MRLKTLSSLALLLLLLNACGENSEQSSTTTDSASAENKGVLLAEVAGEKIYEQELEALLNSMFGEYQASMLDAQGRRKALESLVASKALVKMANKDLTSETLAEIEIKARQYHDNILINAYVKSQFTAQPVDNASVEEYYNAHLESFGQKTIPEYELLTTSTPLVAASRDKFLEAFNKADKTKGLKAVHDYLAKQGFSLQYHKGVLADDVLQEKVSVFIKSQTLHQLSNITFIDDKPHIALVTAEKTLAAKPLGEVRNDIRKTLAMKQLKASIKSLSEDAVKQFSVVYQ